MCLVVMLSEQWSGGGVSHLCINSLIDPVPHCIQHVYSRDRDGKRERVRLGVGQLGIKDRVL